jgi:hypothetical protein
MKTFNRILCLIIITVIIGFTTPADATQRLKYTGIARSTGGAVLGSATVTIYLAGTTTAANVYEASSGGDSVTSVISDSNGRWTFYADVADYAFTQEYKVVVTKDGYSTITLDNIFNLSLPTNAAGVLTNDGSGNYSWGDLGFDESANYTPTGTWDFSGDIEISKVNSAGGSANALTLSGTLGAMDGSDTFRGILIDYTNANHTGSDNSFIGIHIDGITGDAQSGDYGVYVGSGWDYGLVTLSPAYFGGDASTTKGVIYLYDLDNSAYVAITPADVTTAYTLTLPTAAVDEGWTTGLLGFGPDGTGIFVNIDDFEATIPISGEITDEQVACWESSETPGTNKLKSCGAKTTDNSTATHLLCKDDSNEMENCTLSGLAISGTTSPTITVEAMPANATVNAAGEMTVDTTTDQIRWYGTAQQQLSPKLTLSVVVPSVADTDDMLIMKAPYGMTITALDCIVSAATSATINIQECDSAGANCVDTATSDLACDTDGANTTTLNNATVDSGDWLKLDVASISGTPGTLTVTVTYTIVAD